MQSGEIFAVLNVHIEIKKLEKLCFRTSDKIHVPTRYSIYDFMLLKKS